MKINAFADLCLRIVMALAREAPQTSRELAEAVGIPYNHVSKAVTRLRELGLLDVQRGRQGGSRLTESGESATVGWVLRAINSREDVADCVRARDNGEAPHVCPLIGGCGLRDALNDAREAFYEALDDVVIAEVARRGAELTGRSAERAGRSAEMTGRSADSRGPRDAGVPLTAGGPHGASQGARGQVLLGMPTLDPRGRDLGQT